MTDEVTVNPPADGAAAPAQAATPAAPTITAEGADQATPPAPANFPDNWREQYAGEDKKRLGQLQRFTSPKAALDSYFALQQKISSGEFKSPLAKDATPEQVAEWRKGNGIPEKPDGYDLNLGDGLVIGEQDKPLVNKFLESMHGVNAPPETVKSALSTYYKIVQDQQVEQETADADRWRTTEDTLRAEWGGEYRTNQNLIKGLVATAPESVREQIANARLADGSRLGDNPETVRWMAQLAKEINPAATIVPGAGNNASMAIDDEINALTKKMGDHNSDYWKGPDSVKNQARYRDLITARDKMKARAA